MFILLLWKAFSFNSCTSCYGNSTEPNLGKGGYLLCLLHRPEYPESFKNIILGLLFRWLHGCFLRTDIGEEHGETAKTQGRKVRDSVPESAVMGRKSKDLFLQWSSFVFICSHGYLPLSNCYFCTTFFKKHQWVSLKSKEGEVLYQTQKIQSLRLRSHLWAHVFVLFLTCIWLMLWH